MASHQYGCGCGCVVSSVARRLSDSSGTRSVRSIAALSVGCCCDEHMGRSCPKMQDVLKMVWRC